MFLTYAKIREPSQCFKKETKAERREGGGEVLQQRVLCQDSLNFLLSCTVQTRRTTPSPCMHRTTPVSALETQPLRRSPGPRRSGTTAHPKDKLPRKDVLALRFPFILGPLDPAWRGSARPLRATCLLIVKTFF